MTLFQNVNPFYFLTFNTHLRRKLLDSSCVHEAFRNFALRANAEHGIAVGRYVLMPDHAHLFVRLPQDMKLIPWVKALKCVLGAALTAKGHHGSHWQRGFFDHVLRNSESYSLKWDYVRMNPVRAGLVNSPGDWPFQGEIVGLSFD